MACTLEAGIVALQHFWTAVDIGLGTRASLTITLSLWPWLVQVEHKERVTCPQGSLQQEPWTLPGSCVIGAKHDMCLSPGIISEADGDKARNDRL
jgi:hypothetical protein